MNPYLNGQQLTFVSNEGVESALLIRDVEESKFYNGLGSPLNEHQYVRAYRESRSGDGGTEVRILSFAAGTNEQEEEIQFSFSLKEAPMRITWLGFSDFLKMDTTSLVTGYGNYSDVLIFEVMASRKKLDNRIVRFYWSKSKGYIRFIQYDGTIWDLKSVK